MAIKLIQGVGINDAGYTVKPVINGKQVACVFFSKWERMITRCYSAVYQLKRPTYVGCVVCDEWIKFSNFKDWMENQDWAGKELDKDILGDGKLYSPENCAFVDALTNTFINENLSSRGESPIGVDICKKTGRFRARCQNPFTKKLEHLGYFEDALDAHRQWKKRKHELSVRLSFMQEDSRVANALRARYL